MSLFIFICLNLLIFLSIMGVGKLTIKLTCLKDSLFDHYNILIFIIGLLAIGLLGIIYNYFFKIDDKIVILLIFIGLITYLALENKSFFQKKEILVTSGIISLSVIFSYLSQNNDDFFHYHYAAITDYKNNSVFEIIGSFKSMYNSYLLFLNSLFYITIIPQTIYSITSLFYSIIVFDLFKSYKRNRKIQNELASIYAILTLIFLLGVMNSYKEFGTDFVGQIIIILIFLIFFEKEHIIYKVKENNILNIILILSIFGIMNKISNSFILFLIFYFYLKVKEKKYFTINSLILLAPFVFWLSQNYILSNCLIWPISITCLENSQAAADEMWLVQIFARSLDSSTNPVMIGLAITDMNIKFKWVPLWFQSHFPKILETYVLYFLICIFPFIYLLINKNNRAIYYLKNILNYQKVNFIKPYFIFSIFSIFATMMWFFSSPGYRFAIIYNLNFILIILIPLWIIIFKSNYLFFKKSMNIILIISICFFVLNNIIKSYNFVNEYGLNWPLL